MRVTAITCDHCGLPQVVPTRPIEEVQLGIYITSVPHDDIERTVDLCRVCTARAKDLLQTFCTAAKEMTP